MKNAKWKIRKEICYFVFCVCCLRFCGENQMNSDCFADIWLGSSKGVTRCEVIQIAGEISTISRFRLISIKSGEREIVWRFRWPNRIRLKCSNSVSWAFAVRLKWKHQNTNRFDIRFEEKVRTKPTGLFNRSPEDLRLGIATNVERHGTMLWVV